MSSSTSTHAGDTASSLPLLSGEKLEHRLEELLHLIARVFAVVFRIVAKSRRYVEAGHGGLLEVEFVVLA